MGSFEKVKPELISYIESVSDYKTNSYADLPTLKKKKIANAWLPYFKAFGYSTELGELEVENTGTSPLSSGQSIS